MGKITYKQACEVLGVEMVTIHKAVAKGLLTRCAHHTRTAMLLQEQVELFKGKRLSERSLTLQEKELWDKYKAMAEGSEITEEMNIVSFEKFLQHAVEQKHNRYMADLLQVLGSSITHMGKRYAENFLSPLAQK